MSDWKTAAELRAMAEAATGYDRMVLLHLAAVEEEREAAMDPTARPCRDCGNDGTKLGCNEAACACGHMCIMHMTGGACRADDCPCTRFAGAAERLAADALRIGLEECERLRAERDRWIDVAVAYEDRIAALTGDREKVGEWWEVRAASGLLLMGKLSRPAAFGMKYAADRLVHVTRWRKKR